MRGGAVASTLVILMAIAFAMLIPDRQSCPPGQVLTTTGWNEAVPRCYTKPIAQLERGTPPVEESRIGIQVIIVGAGAILALIIMAAGSVSRRSGSKDRPTGALAERHSP